MLNTIPTKNIDSINEIAQPTGRGTTESEVARINSYQEDSAPPVRPLSRFQCTLGEMLYVGVPRHFSKIIKSTSRYGSEEICSDETFRRIESRFGIIDSFLCQPLMLGTITAPVACLVLGQYVPEMWKQELVGGVLGFLIGMHLLDRLPNFYKPASVIPNLELARARYQEGIASDTTRAAMNKLEGEFESALAAFQEKSEAQQLDLSAAWILSTAADGLLNFYVQYETSLVGRGVDTDGLTTEAIALKRERVGEALRHIERFAAQAFNRQLKEPSAG